MAAHGVNKVILVGHLGQDPEVRYMPNGGAVANLTGNGCYDRHRSVRLVVMVGLAIDQNA